MIQLIGEQRSAFIEVNKQIPDLVTAWHWLVSQNSDSTGFEEFFNEIRNKESPSTSEGLQAITKFLDVKP